MKLNYTKLNVKIDVDEIIVLCTEKRRPVKGNVNKQPNSLGSLISCTLTSKEALSPCFKSETFCLVGMILPFSSTII